MHEFMAKLSKKDRYMIFNMFFSFSIMGVYVIMIGSILPMMRDEYGLSYEISGSIVSIHNIGNMAAGLFAGAIAMALSIKTAYIIFTAVAAVGFILTLITHNPIFLLFAFLLTGVGRGVCNNYNNLAVSTIGEGKSAPNNMLHSCFSVGALLSPFIVLLCTKQNAAGWKIVVIFVIALLVLSFILSFRMDMSRIEYRKGDQTANKSFAFLKDKRFALPSLCMFFYQCVEATLMGWLVSYFVEGGYIPEGFSQVLNSILWAAILAGRLACVAIANKLHSPNLVKIMSFGMLIFTIVLLFTNSFALAIVATVGVGLSASGMFGTIMACAGDIFPEYAFSMSAFIAIAGIGASFWPYVIGLVAGAAGMKAGMCSVLIPGILLVITALINERYFKNKHTVLSEAEKSGK